MSLVCLDARPRVDELKSQVSGTTKGSLHSFKCDLQKEGEIEAAFAWAFQKFGGVDVLINNAGIYATGQLTAKDLTPAIREVINTNILGTVICTREAVASMRSRGVDGHVVMINDAVFGHYVGRIPQGPILNIYPGTKFAVTAMTEVLRQEFQSEGSKIKVTVSAIYKPLLIRTSRRSKLQFFSIPRYNTGFKKIIFFGIKIKTCA